MKENNIVAIIQARLSSTRYPQKVLLPLLGEPVISHVINGIKKSKLVNRVVVATTNLDEDMKIVKWCEENKVDFFRGDLHDVLSRFYHCAKLYNASHILRVTSDNPLVDSEIIDKTIEKLISEKADYAANNLVKTYPHGFDVELFTLKSLEIAFNQSTEKYDREHVTQYIRRQDKIFKIVNIRNEVDLHEIRLTLDEKEDFELIEIVMKLLDGKYSLRNVAILFEKYPSLKKINSNAKDRHHTYNKSQNII